MNLFRFEALLLALIAVIPSASIAEQSHQQPAAHTAPARPIETVIGQLAKETLALVGEAGQVLGVRGLDAASADVLSERLVIDAIRHGNPTHGEVSKLWEYFADPGNAALASLPIVKALVQASDAPTVRETLWSELAALSRSDKRSSKNVTSDLLELFERHREELLPLLGEVRETEGGGDEMAYLMTSSKVFGADFSQSLAAMIERDPGAIARLIERERERGRPVTWEAEGFQALIRWRDEHFITEVRQQRLSLEVLDRAGEMFISIFNALHSLGDDYRAQMLEGLGPVELFDAAVSGEQQLYRLGTSGYRQFLHPGIMRGIQESGSFEDFLERAEPHPPVGATTGTAQKRGMVFVRIATSFGLLDPLLDTIRDRERFISETIAALGDPRSFEGSTSIVIEVLTGRAKSPKSLEFKAALLDRLYGLYRSETESARRSVFGSMLSAYQTVTDDRRDSSVDRDFPLDRSLLSLPFDRVFTRDKGGEVHRIFMRLHDDLDAARTFTGFRRLMKSLRASVAVKKNFVVYRLAVESRTVEIYVNNPDTQGIADGIAAIGKLLNGAGVATIVGRGHTGIISSLQKDSQRILGEPIRGVAVVFVGTCGSDASVREMIRTFGYVPFVTTKSSGRQTINNAILGAYIKALLAIRPGQPLSISDVLDKALAPFLKDTANELLREDAELYQLNVATALASRLYDTHVRRFAEAQLNTPPASKYH